MADHDATTYGAAIADDYDALYDDHLDTEGAVARLAEVATRGPVLELGIGTGWLALFLSAGGLDGRGVDSSPAMVDQLRRKPGGAALDVTVGDFADLDLGATFALVVLAFHTVFALPDHEAQVRCFANAARHLRPGRRFVVEAWVPDVGAFRAGRAVRPRIVAADRVPVGVAELDPLEQRMRTTQVVLADGSVRLHPPTPATPGRPSSTSWPGSPACTGESREEGWRRRPFTAASGSHVTVYRH